MNSIIFASTFLQSPALTPATNLNFINDTLKASEVLRRNQLDDQFILMRVKPGKPIVTPAPQFSALADKTFKSIFGERKHSPWQGFVTSEVDYETYRGVAKKNIWFQVPACYTTFVQDGIPVSYFLLRSEVLSFYH